MSAQLDGIAPNYRAAMERWPDAPTLANHYRAVSESFGGSGHGLIETVKSFVECVCLTILHDHGEPMPSANPSTSELLVASLRLLGVSRTRGVSKLNKVLSAYNRLSEALNDCRNDVGPIAHGKDGFLDALYSSQLRTYLLTGDALLALILGALEGTEPNLQHTREPYESFVRLHDRIDSSVFVRANVDDDGETPMFVLSIATAGLPDGVELRIEPSRVLYAVDRAAFAEVLAASTTEVLRAEEAAELEVPEAASAVRETSAAEDRKVRFVQSYAGKLDSILADFGGYLESLALQPQEALADSGAILAPSLLATAEQYMGADWRERPSLLSGMRVALGRVLARFGVPSGQGKTDAEHMVSWLRIQIAAGIENPNGAGDGDPG